MNRLLSGTRAPSTPATQFTDLAPHYDELMEGVPYDAWAEYILLLFEIATTRPKRILDCACGTGNVSFELASHGYEVTGVDLSAGMIATAQAKRPKQDTPLPPTFIQADLTNFELNQKFDAATCLYDSFNYILDPEKLEAAFTRIAAHVNSGGVFVFDMNTPWAFEANLFTQRNRHPKKQLHYNWYAKFDELTRICEVEMQFERKTPNGIEHFAEVHRERAYSLAEVNAMLIRSGWNVLKVYDAYTLNSPPARCERWYFLAQRV